METCHIAAEHKDTLGGQGVNIYQLLDKSDAFVESEKGQTVEMWVMVGILIAVFIIFIIKRIMERGER